MKDKKNLKFKLYRVSNHLTLNEASKKLGISVSSLCFYEIGRSEPSIDTLIKMSDLYNVSVDTLINNSSKFKSIEDIIKFNNEQLLVQLKEYVNSITNTKKQTEVKS